MASLLSFQGQPWAPPPVAPVGFSLLADLFDRVAIVCGQQTCSDQTSAFPSAMQSKVVLIDSHEVNEHLQISNVNDHAYKVTQGHAAAWALLDDPNIENVLILEDDYRILNATVANFANGHNASTTLIDINRFVRNSTWQMLRLGFNPLLPSQSYTCSSECECKRTEETGSICLVKLSSNSDARHCDIRRGLPTRAT